MSSLDKMWASFVAMGLMVVAMFLITFARTRTRGTIRVVLSIIAFLLLILGLPYMIVSML